MDCPLFSIIIPHKDIPDLLMRCLKSIPVSEDIQVIVVDDNSPDSDTYLERYPELSRPYLEFVRTTKSGGAGYARNVGLDYAKGKWLLFADADDLYVDDMYEIILPYVESKADVIYFKEKSVLSSDVNKIIKRVDHLNKYIDEYLKTGDDQYIRLRYCQPWGKMVRREYIENHKFRFEEVEYSNDYYFSVCTGYFANEIAIVNRVLYIYTFREDSLAGTFCSKPGELRIRADVSFRVEKMFRHYKIRIEQQRPFKWFLYKMFYQDKGLFSYYFYKLNEIYPSTPIALYSLSKGKSLRFKMSLFLYSIWLWMKR
jgi:glycosyltransferase involved in cell wall biosynthesis